MNTIQLRKLIDTAPLLKVADRALCDTLLKSRTMDLEEMNSGICRADIAYLGREASRKEQDIINIVEGA